jgi:hypothetical protein
MISLRPVDVLPENEQALELYCRHSFIETGAIHGGEIVMERRL